MDNRRAESIKYAKKVEAGNKYKFTVAFNGTDENVETHNRFEEYCQKFDGVYISGIRSLLDLQEQMYHYNSIISMVDELNLIVGQLQSENDELRKLIESKEDKKVMKTFG